MKMGEVIKLDWQGPFAWPGCGPHAFLGTSAASLHGLYSWGINCSPDKYLICGFGITRNSFSSRLSFHDDSYRNGRYAIYDERIIQGVREDHWRGLWWSKKEWKIGRPEFETKRPTLDPLIERLLRSFQIFVAPVTAAPRVLERIESSMYDIFRADPTRAGLALDDGWALSRRFPHEKPFLVQVLQKPRYVGLPSCFEA